MHPNSEGVRWVSQVWWEQLGSTKSVDYQACHCEDRGPRSRIKSADEGREPDQWGTWPAVRMAAAAPQLRLRSPRAGAKGSSQVKKWAPSPRLLLAFPQRAPRPSKVSWTVFFYQRARLEHRELNLRLWVWYRPVQWKTQGNASITFHTYEV